MKKVIKYILMGFGAAVIIGVIAASFSDTKTTKTNIPVKDPTSTQEKASSVNQEPAKDDIEILQQTAKYEAIGDMNTVIIHVQVQNNTEDLKDYVEVKATFYDKKGKIVGTGMGNTTNLAAHAKRTIDVRGMDIDGGAKYDLEIKDQPF